MMVVTSAMSSPGADERNTPYSHHSLTAVPSHPPFRRELLKAYPIRLAHDLSLSQELVSSALRGAPRWTYRLPFQADQRAFAHTRSPGARSPRSFRSTILALS
jgi:hypothetical protein